MAWDSVHLFECPTRVRYGVGAAAEAGARLAELDVSRALLVSDPGIQAAGAVDRVAEYVNGSGIDVVPYLEVEPNPTTENVDGIVALFAEHRCDGLIGLGGGSSMDAAKAASALVANGGSVVDYAGKDKVPQRGPPVLCMPTTCGTGAEVTFVVVITDPDRHFKIVCASRNLAASVALVDPELVLSAPPAVIAATGADALAHATESFVNLGSDPLLDSINIAAIRMIGENLRPAVNGGDPGAIGQLSLASVMTGIAFNMNANAVVHAASTPVTAHHAVPHGVANAIFLAEGLDLLRPGCEEKLAAIASALGERVGGLGVEQAAVLGVAAVRLLLSDVGLPSTLREFGIDPEDVDIPTLVEDAMKSRNIATNPRPVGPGELDSLYRAVIG
ncbi:MAG: iron-containing alcohol dehydrogenase [Gaiellales bacterium]